MEIMGWEHGFHDWKWPVRRLVNPYEIRGRNLLGDPEAGSPGAPLLWFQWQTTRIPWCLGFFQLKSLMISKTRSNSKRDPHGIRQVWDVENRIPKSLSKQYPAKTVLSHLLIWGFLDILQCFFIKTPLLCGKIYDFLWVYRWAKPHTTKYPFPVCLLASSYWWLVTSWY